MLPRIARPPTVVLIKSDREVSKNLSTGEIGGDGLRRSFYLIHVARITLLGITRRQRKALVDSSSRMRSKNTRKADIKASIRELSILLSFHSRAVDIYLVFPIDCVIFERKLNFRNARRKFRRRFL